MPSRDEHIEFLSVYRDIGAGEGLSIAGADRGSHPTAPAVPCVGGRGGISNPPAHP